MTANDTTPTAPSMWHVYPKSPLTKRKRIVCMLLLAGWVACSAIFIVSAIIGVVRGYSVQSHWSGTLALSIGFSFLMVGGRILPTKLAMGALFLTAILLTGSYWAVFNQGKHLALGEQYYEQGKYEEALVEFKKEIDTWHLRLQYNYREKSAAYEAARAYCQLGDFDEACNLYETAIARYDDSMAKSSLKKMRDALDRLPTLQQAIDSEGDQRKKAHAMYDMALPYRYPLYCDKKAIEIYQQILNLDDPDVYKALAIDQIEKIQAKYAKGKTVEGVKEIGGDEDGNDV